MRRRILPFALGQVNVRSSDYLGAGGWKEHEGLFYDDEVEVTRR